MISTLGLSVKFLKEEPYSGSYRGMRFTFCQDGNRIVTSLYPEPWCLKKTKPEAILRRDFPFSEAGLTEAISWADAMYESEKDRWMAALQGKENPQ